MSVLLQFYHARFFFSEGAEREKGDERDTNVKLHLRLTSRDSQVTDTSGNLRYDTIAIVEHTESRK